jgi:hypothetical protein
MHWTCDQQDSDVAALGLASFWWIHNHMARSYVDILSGVWIFCQLTELQGKTPPLVLGLAEAQSASQIWVRPG